jgi:hypothetical protein
MRFLQHIYRYISYRYVALDAFFLCTSVDAILTLTEKFENAFLTDVLIVAFLAVTSLDAIL